MKKNTVIYLVIATLAFWGGLYNIFETQSVPDNANFIVGLALAVFEIWWFKFCWPDIEFSISALILGGIPILIGLYGLSIGNPLTPGVLVYFIAGTWLHLWWAK
ncbi:MAG TPA: hypothetical protein VJJ22_00545 [Candidatus Paceibacterota bacterium]